MENGYQKTVLLNREEIYNLSAAILSRSQDEIYTFYYDGPEKKISGILDLNKVQFVDIDDRDLDYRGLELLDYNKLRIWKEPNFFRKTLFKIKWFFADFKNKGK